MLSKEVSTMNVFAGINSIDDYEAIPNDYKVICDYVENTYETTQSVYLDDGFDGAKGILKYNYKGYSIQIVDGRRMDGYFDKFRYVEFKDESPRENYLIFDNDKLVFSNYEDKNNFIIFLTEYNEGVKKFIELGIEEFSANYETQLNSAELKHYASNLIGMLPQKFLTNVMLHDLLIYYLTIWDNISKTYIGFSNEDVDRNAKFLRDNKELYDSMKAVNSSLISKYKTLLQKKYEISDIYSQFFAFRSIDNVFALVYCNSWENSKNYISPLDQTIDGFTNYIYQCLNNNAISLEDEASLLMFAYYCREKFNLSPRNIRTIVFDIAHIIKDYNTKMKDKQFTEKILFGNTSLNTRSNYSIDLMTGSEFEEFIAKLFIKMGYSAYTTKTSGDQGIDVIAEKNGIKYGIQAKCYSGSVGNSAVQEAVAGKLFYGCDKVIVITNNTYTKSAVELAAANGVILWDRTILKEKLVYINQ